MKSQCLIVSKMYSCRYGIVSEGGCTPHSHPGAQAGRDSGIVNMRLPRSFRALMSSRQVGRRAHERLCIKF